MKTTSSKKTRGLIAAPFTPMGSDGAPNLDIIDAYARWLHDNKVVGAFICGTTGEGKSLTLDERRKVAEKWVAVAPRGLRVVVHVGYAELADCRALAAHAQSIGADSIASMAPSGKAMTVEQVATWCAQVASSAPKLPFYYYHMPSVTGFEIKVAALLKLVASTIPNFAGVKFTFEDLADFTECLRFENGRYDVLFGRDELLLSALERGAHGAVGSTYNFAAPLYYAIIAAFERGEKARAAELQALAVRMINAMVAAGPTPVANFKWLMRKTGIDCGPTRPPLVAPAQADTQKLEIELRAAGVDEWIRSAAPSSMSTSAR